ncbi:5-formyltetrahydrofolate cyclo-ligase [Actinomadura sp. WAC 06369]|uniref:5-formyltetrahydrofolate cyclo-ligase n=1 Tax=Actinomadura sp. WAC 06369 TaxID=2203193 RepID=UPI000F7ADD9B|nr:5-formyltetrahydrofolate cyclo-ligase [Actinomadura sp. WAC 06369]RSN66805.1 5-formyltetrahydrofolate cyclo-ligase [Actinomadura sp. WAC 06369]
MGLDQAKREARDYVWDLLEREEAVRRRGVHGHIPDFVGSEAAADRLAELPAWAVAEVLKSNPDRAQLPVRTRALEGVRLVYMAVPRLAEELPFYELDPADLAVSASKAATGTVAKDIAPRVGLEQMRPIDMVLCGTVAVDREGRRLGKGAGYSDIEFALAQEAGLISADTVIVTTVHQLQVVDDVLPEDEHDFRVDYIVTPEETIACPGGHRPERLIWKSLTSARIAAIPVLSARAGK